MYWSALAVLPDHLVAAADLLHPERRPGAELAGDNVGTGVLQGRTVASAVAQEELVGHLVQTRRARRLDRRRLQAGRAVGVEILLERRLQRLERILGTRHHARGIAGIVAVAVDVPDDVLVGAAVLPDHLVAAANLLRPERRPGRRTGRRQRRHRRTSGTDRCQRRRAGRTRCPPGPDASRPTSRSASSSGRSCRRR